MSQTLDRLAAGATKVPAVILEELTRGRELLRQREREEQERSEAAWKKLQEQAQADLGALWDFARLQEPFAPVGRNEFIIQLPRWRAVLRVRYVAVSGVQRQWLQTNFGTAGRKLWAVCPSATAPESAWEYAFDRCEALARAERLEVPASQHWPRPEGQP